MTDSYAYLLFRAVLTLAFVLGLLGLSLYALKHFMTRGAKRGTAFSEPIKIISSALVGQKKNLTLVEVAGEILLLGITQSSITCLTKVESQEAVSELKKLGNRRARPFLNIFQ